MPAKSKQQQKFFGVVKSMQKGDIPKKGEAGKVAKDMSKKEVDKYAGTKHKGLPKKVKEMIVQELVKELQLNEDIPEFSTKAESIEYEMNKIQKGVSISEREPGKFRARWTYARHPLSPTDWKASLKLIIDAGGKIDKNWTRNDYEKNWEPEEPPEWVPSIYFTL